MLIKKFEYYNRKKYNLDMRSNKSVKPYYYVLVYISAFLVLIAGKILISLFTLNNVEDISSIKGLIDKPSLIIVAIISLVIVIGFILVMKRQDAKRG